MADPVLSIIIRNRNEAEYLPDVFRSILNQKFKNYEIIFVDNASTDNSVSIAEGNGAKVLHIPKGEFTYGKALNMGLEIARGTFCLIQSAHSILVGPHFLDDCIIPFDDPSIAAVRCMYSGKKQDAKNILYPQKLSDPGDIQKLLMMGPLASACVIRRSTWKKIPFNEEIRSAEEKIWALEALKMGYKSYATSSSTYIYIKNISVRTNLKNTYRDLLAIYEYSGLKFGFIGQSKFRSVLMFFYALFKVAPLAFWHEVMLAFLQLQFIFMLNGNAKK